MSDDGISLPHHVDAPVKIRIDEGGAREATAEELLQVFFGSPDSRCEGRVAVAGRYDWEGGIVSFTPTFGFVADVDYVAQVRVAGERRKLVPFSIPSEAAAATAAVTEVFPSGDVLPENLLRFYIHFSVPMAPHRAFEHIELRDARGVVDDAVFMRFKQELWDEDRTRLTVLIDPGRIKREEATNVELGPALLAGHRYSLVVRSGWPSADGTSALAECSKTFTVSEPLRERPDRERWQVVPPCPMTRNALEVQFDRPFDRHLLSTGIRVISSGHEVDGTVHIDANETIWRFIPHEPWADEDVRVVVDSSLEDVAGNRIRELLDDVVSHENREPRTELLVPPSNDEGSHD